MKIAKLFLFVPLILMLHLVFSYYNYNCESHNNKGGEFDRNVSSEQLFDALYASQDKLDCPKIADKSFTTQLIEKTESYAFCEMRTLRFPSLNKPKIVLKFEDDKLRLYQNSLPYPEKYATCSVLPEPRLSKEAIYQSIVTMSSVLFKGALGDYAFSSDFHSTGVDFDGKHYFPVWYVSWSREIDGIPLRYEGGSATLDENFGWMRIVDCSVSTNYIHRKQDADKSIDANNAFADIMKDYSGLIKTTLGESHSLFLNSTSKYEIKKANLCYINPRFFVPFRQDKIFNKYTAILAWEIPIVLFNYDSNSKKRFFDVVFFWVDNKTKKPLGFGCSIIPDKFFFSRS